MTNVLDFISAPIASTGSNTSTPTASTPKFSAVAPLLTSPIGPMSESTPAVAKPGTMNITPVSVAKGLLQGAARAPFQAGTSVGQLITDSLGIKRSTTMTPSPNKTVFGEAPIDTVQGEYAKQIAESKAAGTPSYIYRPLAGFSLLGTIAADVLPPIFPEGDISAAIKDGTIPEAFFKSMAKETNPEVISNLLKDTGLSKNFIDELAPSFAKTKTAQEAKDALIEFADRQGQAKLPTGEPDFHMSPDMEVKAEADWAHNFQDEYTQITDRATQIQNEIKTGPKSAVPALQQELRGLLQKGGAIEESFIKKWNPQASSASTPNKTRTNVNDFLSKPVSDVVGTAEIAPKTALETSTTRPLTDYGSLANTIAKSTNPAEIAKLLENTGVDKSQIPQMSKVLAGVDSPKKVNNIIEGFDTSRAPRQQPELPPQLSGMQTELELKKQSLNESPFKSVANREMVDREGRIKELGDQKNPAVIRKMEDRMAEAGIKDPAEFSAGVEKYFKQKDEVRQLEKTFHSEKKNYLDVKKNEAVAKERISQGKLATPQPDEIAMNDNFENIESLLTDSTEGKTILDKELETIRSLPKDLRKEIEPLSVIVQKESINVKQKVTMLDYLRTPEKVLQKIGLGQLAKDLTKAYDSYLQELPIHIEQITEWSKQIDSSRKGNLFDYLDGKPVSLRPDEMKVAKEIEHYLSNWADRLGLSDDNRISHYITHIFEQDFIQKEFDPELAKIIGEKIPGQVYDPFLEKRLGKMGFVRDPFRALDAYTKRATRKANMDPVLKRLKEAGPKLEESQWNYIKRYADRINMRPTEIDNLIDNQFKQLFGYRFGQRPVANITKTLRQMVFRGALGFNMGSAFRNLSQGANTYAVLGEKYTGLGYASLLKNGMKELTDNGVLLDNFVEDRSISATKDFLNKADKGLMVFFDTAEKINRGSAYYGAKLKAINEGLSEEQAIDYAKHVVAQTQFRFSPVDTPVALQGDLVKVFTQFMTYPIKQTEFLAELAKTKSWGGLIRYLLASFAIMATVGKLYGSNWSDINPTSRFTDGNGLLAPIPKTGVDFLQLFTGSKSAYNQPEDVKTRIGNLVKDLTIFAPAGTQIKKTYQGIEAVSNGKDVTATGKTRYTIPPTPTNYIRAGLFGKNNLPEAQAYFNKTGSKTTPPASSGGTKLPLLPKLPSLKGASAPAVKTSLPKLPKLPKLNAGKPQASNIGSKIGSVAEAIFGVQTASAAGFPEGYQPPTATTTDGVNLRTVPPQWKGNIESAYNSHPELQKYPGLIEAILMQESSMGVNDRNYNPKLGESAWLGGVTDIMKKELERNGKTVDTNSQKGVINAIADYLSLKSKVTNPGSKTSSSYKDSVNLYLQRYKTASGVKLSQEAIQRFRSYLNYYKGSPSNLAEK